MRIGTGRAAAALGPGILVALAVSAAAASAQWTNRYPPVDGYSHHVYLEGYELPVLGVGPTDPAPAPDGSTLAYASRGWLWLLDVESGAARRITRGGEIDARPAWSPDGDRIAFVRDRGNETAVVILDVESGSERVAVDEPAIDLDPAFGPDGRWLYYSTAAAGDLDLWRLDTGSGRKERITTRSGIELRPQPHPDGERVLYVAKGGGDRDEIRIRRISDGAERVLAAGDIVSQGRPALSPDGKTVAYNWPAQEGWELRLLAVDAPGSHVLLTGGAGLPLTPAWSPDGRRVWFGEADGRERMGLRSVPAAGGRSRSVEVRSRDWGAPTGTLRIRTRLPDGSITPARLEVVDERGHPLVSGGSQPRFDGQNGRVFFYSPGLVELRVPTGEVTAAGVRGLLTPEARTTVRVDAGEVREAVLELEPVWDPAADGWYSGDHHFHLNYGGPYDLDPGDLLPQLRGEGLDVATPLLANLHTRFEDQELWRWERLGALPFVRFAQEVRAHFLGHVNLVGARELFWPWVWGPGYEVYGRDDRPNAEALRHARRQGGIGGYVHPVSRPDPFEEGNEGSIPLELVPDGVLGDVDILEVACLWSDELGTADVWYRLLNVGVPVALSAGTDVMTDFYRTMAVGTTRIYVRTGDETGDRTAPEAVSFRSYLEALRAGRSFVTTGPVLDFRVEGAGPGGVMEGSAGSASWTLDLHSAVPVDTVEVLVNGEVVWSGPGVGEPGSRTHEGRIDVPRGGWIAARARHGEMRWPGMDSYPFAQTGPVWIRQVGSTEPSARRAAARDLLRVLERGEERLRAGYGETPIPKLLERFEAARQRLRTLIQE